MTMDVHREYDATIRIRRDKGKVKPEADALDGRRARFTTCWLIEADDSRYPGEFALAPSDTKSDVLGSLAWIASGDLTDIAEVLE